MTATAVPITPDEETDTLIRAVISRVWRKYQRYVDFADLQQEAAVWWYGKGQRYLSEYLTDANKGRISISVYRVCEAYARAQKAQCLGYEAQDQYTYQPREIVDLIPIALDPDGLPERAYASDGEAPPKPHSNLAEGGDLLAALVDVRRALRLLPEADLHFLTLADDCGYDWERVAARTAGGAPDSLRRRYARTAERMARWLNNNSLED